MSCPVVRDPVSFVGSWRALNWSIHFHELLEHRWYLSERNGHDVPIGQAMADYILTILPAKPVEETVVGVDTVEMPVVAHLYD